ncbi:hypothetical protein EIP86_005133 [Pleurotus ostreatoroseus]|nr:hypothetical protein EIP86_005133 [Pleurotus ostreatoroseus]
MERWLIKKLTRTYITLGLRDIAQEVGIETEDEVRATIVSMVEAGEISASISVEGTVTFLDSTAQISRADIETALSHAQEQSKMLLELERTLNSSRDYLQKALKYKDENWGAPDEDIYSGHGGYDDGLY